MQAIIRKRLAVAILLAATQLAGCQTLPAQAGALHLRLDAAASWQCPPGQTCGPQADYRALQVSVSGSTAYLLFAPQLAAPYDAEQLNRHFRFADLYWPQADGRVAIHAANDGRAEATLTFLPAPPGKLIARVSASRYRVQSPTPAGEPCRTDDVQGFCRQERRVDAPLDRILELNLPAE